MGYSIHIKTDKPVQESELDHILAGLSPKNKGPFPSKQQWGWSMACDIRLNEGNVVVSGSYSASGSKAESTTRELTMRLKEIGYKTRVDKSDF